MTFRGLTAMLVVAAFALGAAPLAAKEYNKRTHLAPEQRAKVDRTIAKSRILGSGIGRGDQTNVGCGKLEVGVVKLQPGQRAPRENIVVVTGDVINVAQGCRSR